MQLKGNDGLTGRFKKQRRYIKKKVLNPCLGMILAVIFISATAIGMARGGQGGQPPSSPSSPPPPPPLQKQPAEKKNLISPNSNFCSDYYYYSQLTETEQQTVEISDTASSPFCVIFRDSDSASLNSESQPLDLTVHKNSLAGVVEPGQYKYFRICVARHQHYHRVKLSLKILLGSGAKAETGTETTDADLYISNIHETPTLENAVWISRDKGDDSISLPTFMDEFDANHVNALFVGVHGREEGERRVEFTLGVEIEDVGEKEVLKRSMLRGGQRTMPKREEAEREEAEDAI